MYSLLMLLVLAGRLLLRRTRCERADDRPRLAGVALVTGALCSDPLLVALPRGRGDRGRARAVATARDALASPAGHGGSSHGRRRRCRSCRGPLASSTRLRHTGTPWAPGPAGAGRRWTTSATSDRRRRPFAEGVLLGVWSLLAVLGVLGVVAAARRRRGPAHARTDAAVGRWPSSSFGTLALGAVVGPGHAAARSTAATPRWSCRCSSSWRRRGLAELPRGGRRSAPGSPSSCSASPASRRSTARPHPGRRPRRRSRPTSRTRRRRRGVPRPARRWRSAGRSQARRRLPVLPYPRSTTIPGSSSGTTTRSATTPPTRAVAAERRSTAGDRRHLGGVERARTAPSRATARRLIEALSILPRWHRRCRGTVPESGPSSTAPCPVRTPADERARRRGHLALTTCVPALPGLGGARALVLVAWVVNAVARSSCRLDGVEPITTDAGALRLGRGLLPRPRRARLRQRVEPAPSASTRSLPLLGRNGAGRARARQRGRARRRPPSCTGSSAVVDRRRRPGPPRGDARRPGPAGLLPGVGLRREPRSSPSRPDSSLAVRRRWWWLAALLGRRWRR